jgi:hypothetical protein
MAIQDKATYIAQKNIDFANNTSQLITPTIQRNDRQNLAESLAWLSDANTYTGQQRFNKGADVASATVLPLISDGNYFDVTGTVTVTSFADLGGAGTVIILQFDAACILTHHATNLILPTGGNITTAAGDNAIFVNYASGDYRCLSYQRADGTPLVGGDVTKVGTPVNNQVGVWTGDGTLEGDSKLTFDGTTLGVTGGGTFSSSVTAQSLITSYSLDGDPALATFTNANAGTSAEATIYVRNGTTSNDATFIQALGTGFTTTGGFVQDAGIIGTGTDLSGGMSLMVRANADMRFYTNGHTNERMRITSGGNVGIGGNPSTDAKLELRTTGGIAKPPSLRISNDSDTSYFWDIWRDNTTGDLNFGSASPTTVVPRVAITSGGDMWYNYNNMSSANATYRQSLWGGLSILYRGAEDAYINANHTYNSANQNIATYNSTNGIGRLELTGGNLQWYTYNGTVVSGTAYAMTSKVTITSGGNVGIGTSSPRAKLNLEGGSTTSINATACWQGCCYF